MPAESSFVPHFTILGITQQEWLIRSFHNLLSLIHSATSSNSQCNSFADYCFYCFIHLPCYCSTPGMPPLLFPFFPKCFLVLRVVYPKLRTNEVKKGNDFSKKREKRSQRFVSGSQKDKFKPYGCGKKSPPIRVVFFSTNLLFGNPSRIKRLSFFPFSFEKMFMC